MFGPCTQLFLNVPKQFRQSMITERTEFTDLTSDKTV